MGSEHRHLVPEFVKKATVGSYGEYKNAGYDVHSNNRSSKPMFYLTHLQEAKELYDQLSKDFEAFKDDNDLQTGYVVEERPKDAYIYEYMKSVVDHYEASITTIEKWKQTQLGQKKTENAANKELRRNFFTAQARTLTPPITPDLLNNMQAFRNAIEIPTLPKDHPRAWNMLRPKLEAERSRAEQMRSWQQRARDPHFKTQLRRVDEMRKHNLSPEKMLVQHLAGCAVREMKASSQYTALSDQDFTIVGLRKVWHAYQSRDDKPPCPFDGRKRYELTFEDAIDAFALLLSSRHSADGGGGVKKHANLFLCPGCKRKDVNQRRNLRDLFAHLLYKKCGKDHEAFWPVCEAGEFEEGRYSWLAVKWPRNLPLLGSGEEGKGMGGKGKFGVWDTQEEKWF